MTTDHVSGTLPPESELSGAIPVVGPDGTPVSGVNGPLSAPGSPSSPLLMMQAGRDGSGDGYSSQSVVHSGATTAIEFRVTRPESPVRRLRLSGPRYTFGSGEGCSIRLSDDDLLPLHAVLSREPERINVRAYSVPIEINGDRVSEGTLRLGDILTLGSYRFELLSTSASDPIRGAAFQVPAFGGGDPGPWGRLSFLDSTLVTAESGLASELAGPEAARGNVRPGRGDGRGRADGRDSGGGDERWWRERLRREVDLWRARQAECDRRQAECDRRDARCDGRESELHHRESELWGRLEQLRQRESELSTAAFRSEHAERTLTEAHNQLERLRRENDDRSREFERREEELKQAEAECRRRAEAAERELTAARGQADTASEAVEAMRTQFVTLRQQLADLTEQHAALESREQTRREEYESNFETINGELERARQDARAERQRAAECEELAEQLDAQVVELQQAVEEARQESERLRQECALATRSIAELEPLAEQGRQSDEQRTAHEAEVRRLSESIDRLTDDLSVANNELSLLRESNQDLVKRLEQTRVELDAAIADADSRPTREEVRSLRDELESAQEQLAALRREGDRDPSPRTGDAAAAGQIAGRGETAGTDWNGDWASEGERAAEAGREHDPIGEDSLPGWHSPSWFRSDEEQQAGGSPEGETAYRTANWETVREEAPDPTEVADQSPLDVEHTSAWGGPDRVAREPDGWADADRTVDSERTEPTTGSEPEDDSIEAYMNRLLQRVHGPSHRDGSATGGSAQDSPVGGGSAIGPAGASLTEAADSTLSSTRLFHDSSSQSRPLSIASPSSEDEAAEGRAANDEGTSGGGVPEKAPESRMVPRSHPPEKDNKIEALRDLANESAHSAIARSARIQTRDSQLKGLGKLLAASVAALSGVAAWWWIHGPVRLLGVSASTIVTGFFLYEAVSLIRDARRRVALLEAGRFDQLINSHTRVSHSSPNSGHKGLADSPVKAGDAKLESETGSGGEVGLKGDVPVGADAALEGEGRGGLDIGRDTA